MNMGGDSEGLAARKGARKAIKPAMGDYFLTRLLRSHHCGVEVTQRLLSCRRIDAPPT